MKERKPALAAFDGNIFLNDVEKHRMPHYVAFLRGINLGNRRLKMDGLRRLFEELAFENVRTFIASGNVLFESRLCDDAELARKIERYLKKSLGYEVDTFVRTRAEIAAVAASEAFSRADLTNPANAIHVGFLKEPLVEESRRRLHACRTPVDEFFVDGREFYWLCRIKSSESKVWRSAEMKTAALPPATMRNLTTIRKLAALEPDL